MRPVIYSLFVLLLLIHQDLWNWADGTLLMGFMPVGLAYHAVFSIACAGLGALAIKTIWPSDVDEEEEVVAPSEHSVEEGETKAEA